MSKQAIAGVTPPEEAEVTIMTVWPSVAAIAPGRFLGTMLGNKTGSGIFTLGNLVALLAMPLGPLLYLGRLAPYKGMRYRLTNRRVRVELGWSGTIERFISLEDFDNIDIKVLPGQAWYKAGELIFRKGAVETFRLSGVSRPDTFRQTCLRARMGILGAKREVQRQLAHA